MTNPKIYTKEERDLAALSGCDVRDLGKGNGGANANRSKFSGKAPAYPIGTVKTKMMIELSEQHRLIVLNLGEGSMAAGIREAIDRVAVDPAWPTDKRTAKILYKLDQSATHVQKPAGRPRFMGPGLTELEAMGMKVRPTAEERLDEISDDPKFQDAEDQDAEDKEAEAAAT